MFKDGTDHDEDCVYAALSDCGGYCFHHWAVAEVDVEVGCGGELEVFEEMGHD